MMGCRPAVSIAMFLLGVASSDYGGRESTPGSSSEAALLALQKRVHGLESTVKDQQAIIKHHEEQINQLLAMQHLSDQRIASLEANFGAPVAVIYRDLDKSVAVKSHCSVDIDGTSNDSCGIQSSSSSDSTSCTSSTRNARSSSSHLLPTKLLVTAISEAFNDEASVDASDSISLESSAPKADVLRKTSEIATLHLMKPHLLNGWIAFEEFESASFYKDASGWVHLDGVITSGSVGGYDSSSAAFYLPEGFRPDSWQPLLDLTHHNTVGRVDVLADGEVHMAIGSSTWMSLCGLSFLSANLSSPNDAWLDAHYEHGWITYVDSEIFPARYLKNERGVVHLDGLIAGGRVGSAAFTLPVGFRPQFQVVLAVVTHSNAMGRVDIQSDGQVIMLGNPGYISLAGLWFIVPGLTTWRPVDAFLNGWAPYQDVFPYAPPRFTRNTEGFVFLDGMMSAGDVGAAAFALPAGYRPRQRQLFVVLTYPDTVGRLEVSPATGEVILTAGHSGWVSLSGLSFFAAESQNL